jgi:hypothetical protein
VDLSFVHFFLSSEAFCETEFEFKEFGVYDLVSETKGGSCKTSTQLEGVNIYLRRLKVVYNHESNTLETDETQFVTRFCSICHYFDDLHRFICTNPTLEYAQREFDILDSIAIPWKDAPTIVCIHFSGFRAIYTPQYEK